MNTTPVKTGRFLEYINELVCFQKYLSKYFIEAFKCSMFFVNFEQMLIYWVVNEHMYSVFYLTNY